MVNKGKIVIIGTSNVGSAVLNKLMDFQLASEIVLIDLNEEKAKGEALDASHSTSCIYSTNINIRAGSYAECKDAGIIIITAGPSIRPGEEPDRLRLAYVNTKIMSSVMTEIVKYTKDAMLLIITNPLDVATYHISTTFDYPREKIIGTGTLLETFRFRRILANKYHVDTKNIHGYVLGEHGNSAFPAWSTVDVAGLGLEHLDEYFHLTEKLDRTAVEKEIVQVAYDVINWKGFTNTGIAMAACRFVKAIIYDEHTILPMSAVLEGEYGIKNVALSIPRMLCSTGIVRSFEIRLANTELQLLHASAKSVRLALDSCTRLDS
ncbi:L-lactate dehydrogenase [Propionispira arboris]|uniref:L-lactate dehydrogenase n=1 Tax=Propionispira arboris TaxID=84035 RepID=A0A1H7C7V3_9FIRM|nr:L-lactate dehydrogenase [Propionispira arboris]SEJ85859.1 L-lactate dehydrogenase [Propionispira arboris]